MWSARLTHSYFRRENFKFGCQEDWRYTKMARENPRSWWLLSFFAVGLAQQPMLCGISAPLYSIHFSEAAGVPWGVMDTLAFCGAVAGLTTGFFADNQLRTFMLRNEAARNAGRKPVLILEEGLWRYSRHPNYFGEQLWWWSLSLFAVNVGQPWAVAGTAFNSCVLAYVTVMTEQKMMAKPERRELFGDYCRRTSVLIPLPRFSVN